jgi:hypothetical protein
MDLKNSRLSCNSLPDLDFLLEPESRKDAKNIFKTEVEKYRKCIFTYGKHGYHETLANNNIQVVSQEL